MRRELLTVVTFEVSYAPKQISIPKQWDLSILVALSTLANIYQLAFQEEKVTKIRPCLVEFVSFNATTSDFKPPM